MTDPQATQDPPLPAGYTLTDAQDPPPPAGYTVTGNIPNDPETLRKFAQANQLDPRFAGATAFPVYLPGSPAITKPIPGAPEGIAPSQGPVVPNAQPVLNPGAQLGAGVYQGAGALFNLFGQATNLIDRAAQTAADLRMAPRTDFFKQMKDWAAQKEQEELRTAGEFTGGRTDFASKTLQGVGSGLIQAPLYAVAGEALGPALGPAAIAGLANADKGFVPALTSAAQAAILGKSAQWMAGAGGAPLALPGTALMTYGDLRYNGEDHETALAGALGMTGLAAAQPGGLQYKSPIETAQNIGEGARNLANLPARLVPKVIGTGLNPAQQRAVQFFRNRNISLGAGVETGNPVIQGAQALAETSPLGYGVAGKARAATQEGMEQAAGELAARAHPDDVTPETAGAAVAGRLGEKIAVLNAHEQQSYGDAWKGMEDPQYAENVQVGTEQKPVLDAAGKPTGAMQSVPVMGNVQMPVDIRWLKDIAREELPYLENLPAAEQAQTAAVAIFKNSLKLPDHVPARMGEEMLKGFKGETRGAESPDLQNYSQGQSARVIPRLQEGVDAAVAKAGPEKLAALREGRQTHAMKMEVAELARQFRKEPVQTFQKVTWGRDTNIAFLREIEGHAPGALKQVGRAFLRTLFDKAAEEGGFSGSKSLLNRWNELGPETKKLLFPDANLRGQIDDFFLGAKMYAEKAQPSKTALVGQTALLLDELTRSGLMMLQDPIHGAMGIGSAVLYMLGGRAATKLFYSPRGIKLLTGAMKPESPQAAAWRTSQLLKITGKDDVTRLPPEEGPPTGGGAPPPPVPTSGGTAAQPAPEAETPEPGIGQKLKDFGKRFLKEEEGSLTLGNLRKADRAAGSEQSTRVPRAVKSTEDPLANILTTGYESWKRDPAMMAKNVNAMLEYPNFHDLRDQVKSGALSIPDAAEHIITRIGENLQWLHDSMPAEFRDRARLWYDGAHKIARRWSGQYGATPEQVAGTMAVTSPGTDWFVNAERARRLLEFWQDRGSKTWDPRMAKTWRDKLVNAVPEDEAKPLYRQIRGKSFADAQAIGPREAAIWFRLYDEAVNPREYPTLTPEGKAGGLARIGSGDPRQFSWSDFGQIQKGLSILEDGSRENIHKQLGQEHKVRNFYNNIINPDSPREHTTIDTHAVAAGLMRPLSQMSTEVGHNFGGAGSSTSSISGESGTYGLMKEAYRRTAAPNGLLPRELQSITWEAIRSMFSPQFKRNPANVEYINSLWRDVSSGKITADAARQRALQYGGGFDRPAWFRGRWNPAIPKGSGLPRKPR